MNLNGRKINHQAIKGKVTNFQMVLDQEDVEKAVDELIDCQQSFVSIEEADGSILDKLKIATKNVTEVYKKGFESGENNHYELFWDIFQNKGDRTDYTNAFNDGWTDDLFKPKYMMRPTIANSMFKNTKISNALGALEIDFSKCIDFVNFAISAKYLTEIGVVDCSSGKTFTYMFYNCSSLKKIRKIIFTAEQTPHEYMFYNCIELEDITIAGVIAHSLNFQWCKKLSKSSLKSIFNVLTATVSEVTIKLPNYCIDGKTDTLTTIESDETLNSAYKAAINNGYTIVFI